MIIDLHTHSYYSADGELSIPELLDRYSSGDIVGLTDHETIGGWEEFNKVALEKDINPIFGVEWFLRNCCHIISYFVDGPSRDFIKFMTERRMKEKRCIELVYDEVKKIYPSIPPYKEILKSKVHPENILGMAALAKHVSTISGKKFKDAVVMLRDIRGNLSNNYIPMTFSPEDILRKINNWNGVSVLAHPYKNSYAQDGRRHKEDVENMIKDLANKGIMGIELFSDGSTKDELEHLLSLAHELGLVVSIGSDYHNNAKGLNPSELKKLGDGVKVEVKKWLIP